MYPFHNAFYTTSTIANLPPQMIPKSEKTEEWQHANLDSLESVARTQFQQNLRFIENYEMIKGKFIPNHYYDDDGYKDMLTQLSKEFEIPSYLRHYDIASQIINTMSGEYQARPDTFHVRAMDEKTDNEYIRKQTDLLQKYVFSQIEAEVAQKLLEMGLDPNKQDFNSPQEQQQYQQTIAQAKQQLSPPAIKDYLKTDWYTAAELWGQHQLELDRQRFKFKEKEKREFEDMLIVDRCFRHFYLTASGYNQETWNPVNTFFHKSPDIEYVEDGDYVGRLFYLTIPAIIDRYGFLMTKAEIESIQADIPKDDKRWKYAAGTSYVFDNYLMPFKDYPAYDMLRQTSTMPGSNNIPYLDSNFFSSLYSGRFFNEQKGIFLVMEAYWKSQRKIGKVTYLDPITGIKVKTYVDEDVVIPKGFKQLDSTFDEDTDEPNTVVWTWINETWKGIKICTKSASGLAKDLYINVKPNEFQFKGDINIYEAKLPVCGSVFSIRNSQSMSLVDFIKPFQIGYNVAVNQAYQEMQKDVGKFIVMGQSMFSDLKDWGGSNAYEKFMLIAKELGVTVIDDGPNKPMSHGGQYPREIDLDASARIISRLKIAETFEAFALKQVGFNEYRLGQQASTATATGIKQGEQRSFAQTESYFTNFSNYLRRCHKMNLDIAQYVQSAQRDITVSYVKSDMSRALIKLLGTDLLLSDLHVYISDSQEEIRELDMIRQLAMSNNTMNSSFYDLAQAITANSPAEILRYLKEADETRQQQIAQQFQLEEQKAQEERQFRLGELQLKDKQFEEEWGKGGTRERIAYMTTFNRAQQNLEDTNADQVPDVLEYEKLNAQANANSDKATAQQQKNDIEREKNVADHEYNMKHLDIEKRKIDANLKIESQQLESVKVLKGQQNKAPAKPPKKKAK
jgi:hypothetical protein